MKETKNLSKSKLILGMFIIVAMLIFMPNSVNAAEVQTISNLEEYRNVLDSTSVDSAVEAKLTSDIDITSLTGGQDGIKVRNNITLDLNGHKITTANNSLKFWLYADANIMIKNGTLEKITNSGKEIIGITHISNEYNLGMNIENVKFTSNKSDTRAIYMWEPENVNMIKKQTITLNNVVFDQVNVTVKPNFDKYTFSNIKLEKGSSDDFAYLLEASYLTPTDVLAVGQGIYYYNESNELTLATAEQELNTIKAEGKPVYVREVKTSPIQVDTADDLLYALKFYPEADIKITGTVDLSIDHTLDEVYDITSTNKIIDLNGNTITVAHNFFKFNYAVEGAGLTITDSSSAKTGQIVGSPNGFNYIFELSSNMTSKSNGTFKINAGTYVGSKYNSIVDMTNLNVTATFENSIYQSPNLIDFDNNCDVTYKVGNITLGGTNGNNIILAQNGNYYYKDILLPDNKAYGYDGSVETLIDSNNHRPTGYVVDQPGYIIIKSDEGFNVSATIDTLEYGYTSHTGSPISVYNRGLNPLTISNVTVDSGNFIIDKTGLQNATVASKATNSEVKIKVKENLNPGTYTATITVTDAENNIHTATVSVKVNPKTINANITMNNWKYGQTASNPTITGLDDLAAGQYEIVYNVKGESTTSTTKPTTPGTYEVSVNSKDTNYKINGKKEFTIEKATLRLAPVYKEAKYNGQYQTADKFKITLNDNQIGTEYSGGSNLSYSLVGEDKIKNVEFTGRQLVVGSTTVGINTSTLDIDNKDYYEISTSADFLKINTNDTAITIKPKNVSKEYHSTLGMVKPSDYEVTGSLVGSDTFADVTYTGERQYAGTTDTSINSFKIMNGNVDVTLCYSNITKAKGQIVISPFSPAEPTPSMTMVVGETITKAQLEDEIGVSGLTATLQTGSVGSYSLNDGFTSDTEGNAILVYTVPAEDINGDGKLDVNSYTITLTITVSNKTNVNLTGIVDNQEFTYDKTNKRPIGKVTYDASTISDSDLEYLFEGTGTTAYNLTSTAPKNAGTYKMIVKVEDSNSTYTGNLTVNFTINKAELTKPEIDEDDLEFEFNFKSSTPELIGFDSNLMTKDGDLSKTNAGDYTITISLKDKNNYTWSDGTNDLTLNWKIKVNEIESIVSPESDSLSIYTYRKNWYYTYQTAYSPSDVNKYYTIDINGTSYDGIEPFVDAGTYTYTLSLIDKVNTSWDDGTITDKVGTMIINKAAGDTETGYLIPTGLYGINGKKLSTVGLPNGFKWNSPDTIITDGMKIYTVTYTPTDTNNYNIKNDQVVTVTGIDEYSITTSVDSGNGTITNFTDKVNEWTEATVEFTPNTGYMIESVKVNGEDKTLSVTNNEYSFKPKQDTTVVVKYKKIPFVITVEDVKGTVVTPNGAVSVNYGEDKEFNITVNKGYELVKVLVDSEDKTSDLVDNKLTLTNITKNMKIQVVVKEIKYEVVQGNNQKYTITKDSEAKFRIDADYTLFETGGKVYVDNTLLANENYTSASGSTIITLNKTYLDTLSKGEHTLKVEFNNGGIATAKFTIETAKSNVDNPKTFDDGIMIYIVTFAIATIGLVFVVRRKKTN